MSKRLAWIMMAATLAAGLWGCGSSSSRTSADGYAPNEGTKKASTDNSSQASDDTSSSYAANHSGAAGSSMTSVSYATSSAGGSNATAGAAATPVATGSAGTASTTGPAASSDAGEGEGDKYAPPSTNPFVLTEFDPLSTFGADVDTASYDIFRRDARAGILPDPVSVRLEEYVNSFAYHYEAPVDSAEEPFAIHLAAGPSLYDTGTKLLRVGIQGKRAPAERGPANLVFLIDISGSMASADKLPLVKVVLGEALDVLKPNDKVSIVTYAGSTRVALSPTPLSEKATIRSVIDGLSAGGSTAGASGMTLAYEQAQSGFVENGINHIVMCTDGDFNVGLSSDADLLALIKDKRKSGITLTALGFGSGNLNDSMMEKVSDAGNGMYSVISDADQAVLYAHERLLSTMIHIAKDMKIQVEFNPAQVLAYRLLGYEDRAIADVDFRNDIVDAGEVGAGHSVTALYEIVPASSSVPSPAGAPSLVDGALYSGPVEVPADAVVLVKVRYKQPGAAEQDPAKEVATALGANAVASGYEGLDADFRWAVAIATFAEILKKSPYARPDQLARVSQLIAADSESATGDKSEFVTLFGIARPLIEARK